MGHKHSRDDILAGAVHVALADGLHALTFGRVAKHVGTSDRIVVYYFPSKADLVTAVLGALGERLQATLGPTLQGPCADPLELVRAAWPLLASVDADAVFALFFEALGLAISGEEPYTSLAPLLVAEWIEWTSGLFNGRAQRRRAQAEAAIAVLDGLLLLRQTAGAQAAERAARTILGP